MITAPSHMESGGSRVGQRRMSPQKKSTESYNLADSEDGGRGPQARTAGGLQKVERIRRLVLHWSFQKEMEPRQQPGLVSLVRPVLHSTTIGK